MLIIHDNKKVGINKIYKLFINMIINKTVDIRVNSNHLKYFRELGYEIKTQRIIIKVNPLHLPKGSHIKVDIQCDNCNLTFTKEFRSVIFEKCGKTFCNKCRHLFREKKEKFYSPGAKEKMIEKVKETFKKNKNNNPNFYKERDFKTKKTKKNKHGDSTYNNQKLRKQTMEKIYGDSNFNNVSKRKKTMKLIYGSETFNNQEKKKKTCLAKYGTEHSNQNEAVFVKMQKSAYQLKKFEETNLFYRGTYELDFLNYCKNNDFLNEIENGPSIKYLDNKKQRIYFPDFIHTKSNTIIEIKSSYTLNKELRKNNLKKDATIRSGYNFLFIVDKNYALLRKSFKL